jgi:hypothetical protein
MIIVRPIEGAVRSAKKKPPPHMQNRPGKKITQSVHDGMSDKDWAAAEAAYDAMTPEDVAEFMEASARLQANQ